MHASTARRLVPAGLAASGILLLVAFPGAAWVASRELRMELQPRCTPSPELFARAAAAHAGDFELQVAAALTPQHTSEIGSAPSALESIGDSIGVVSRLQALAERFPDRPDVYAAILRYMCLSEFKLNRLEQISPTGPYPPPPGTPTFSSPDPLPEMVAQFSTAAAAGERLDPDNAFFAQMRAAALYQQHRDDEADAEVIRAGSRTRWDDYAAADVASRWRLEHAVLGPTSALTDDAIAASTLLPHFTTTRAVARMGLYRAVRLQELADREVRGARHAVGTASRPATPSEPTNMEVPAADSATMDPQQRAVALRHGLMRCGELMRVHSNSLIGSLVGIAVTGIGTGTRPPASAESRSAETAPLEVREQRRMDRYCAYLDSVGRPDEARWARAEMAACHDANQISQAAMARLENRCERLLGLTKWWGAGALFLSNMLILLVLRLLAAIAPAARIRRGAGLTIGRTAVCLTVAVGAVVWQWAVLRTGGGLGSLPSPFQRFDVENYSYATGPGWTALTIFLACSVPLFLLTILGAVALWSRVPLATGIGRGLRGLAVPVACGLLFCCGGIVTQTASLEAAAHALVVEQNSREPAAIAASVGRTWPGVVP